MRSSVDCQRATWSQNILVCISASFQGSASMRAARSVNARAIPNSSLVATPWPPAWRWRNSPMRRLERAATSANAFALCAGSGGDCVAGMSLVLGIANHAVGADRTPQAPLGMEQVEVSHRLAHGEEELM